MSRRIVSALMLSGLFVPACAMPAGDEPGPEEATAVSEQALLLSPVSTVVTPTNPLLFRLEKTAAFGWSGAIDTDQPLSVLGGDFTLGAEIMLQHPHAQRAPIFSARAASGRFTLDYDYFDVAPSRRAKLVLNFGGATATYANTSLATSDAANVSIAGQWHHVALVRSGARVKLFLDGVHQVATGNVDAAGDLIVPAYASLPSASDVLRLGRHDAADAKAQFYGFVDDVSLFTTAMTASQIQSTLVEKKLQGDEANLDGYYSFDAYAPVPTAPHHTPTLVGAASVKSVSWSRSDSADAALLPAPMNATTMRLPFRVGTPFKVLWGNEINSHVGGAAFCWDFVAIGPGWTNDQVQANTKGQALFSSAAGTVLSACDQGDLACNGGQLAKKGPLTDGYDWLKIQHAPGEISTFLHIQMDSVHEAFTAHGLPDPTDPASPTVSVANQQWVARIGTRSAPGDALNYHLHFAFGNADVTVPMAFSNYDASDDEGATWHYVARGVPSQGQWVRNLHL